MAEAAEKLAADVVLGTERSGHSAEDHGRIRKARKALLERDSNEALDVAKGTPVNVGINLRQIGAQFGIERGIDASGRPIRSPEAQDRYDRYTGALDRALRIVDLQKGYNSLTLDEKNNAVEEARKVLLHDRGALGRRFAELSEDEQRAKIAKILEEPDFARYVRDELVELQGQQLTMTSSETFYNNLQNIQALASTQAGRQDVFSRIRENAQQAFELLDDIRNGNPLTSGQRGPQLQETERAIRKLQGEMRSLSILKNALQGRAAAGPLSSEDRILLQHVLNEQNKYAQQIVQVRIANQEKLPSVRQAEEHAIQRYQELIDVADQEARNQIQQQAAQESRSNILTGRNIEEEQIAANMEGVFARAAYRKLLTDYQEAVRITAAQEPGLKENFTKKVNEGLAHQLENIRWRKRVQRRRKGIFGFFRKKREDLAANTMQINQDASLLFRRGPEELLQRVLRGVRVKGEGGFPRSLTSEQINKMMEDKDFVEKWGSEVAQQVMARKSMYAGYTPTEVHYFLNTKWGKEAMRKAMDENEDFRTVINHLSDQGIVNFDSPGFQDKFAHWAAQRPGTLVFPKTSFSWAANGGHIDQIVDRPRPELVPTR
jgi:hypothetical protein